MTMINTPAPFTQNQVDYLHRTRTSWYNVAEGGKRGGKNVLQVLAFCMALQNHPNKLHLIAGVSQTTAKLNIVDCDGFGLMNFFDGKCRQGKYNDRSALFVQTKTGEKIILVSGGAKDGDEKYIKGNTYGMAYVTEANECHPNFIQEVFDRTLSSADRKIFHDLNPKAESHWYYTDVLDFHQEKQRRDRNYGYNYGHFTIADNLSIDDEKLRNTLKTYQKGTVWYERDILGRRKTAQGIIFPNFASDQTPYIIKADELPKRFRSVEAGFDIGGNGSAYAMTCTGQGYDGIQYKLKAEKRQADKMSMDDVEGFVTEFCDYVEKKYDVRIDSINCDHIDVIINTINDNTKYSAGKCYKPPLQDRVFLYSKLFKTQKVKFVEGECDDLIDELCELVFDPKSEEAVYLDDGTMQIDTWDSNIYSESSYWHYIEV
jgi:PBSX family phage terminase large subunit